MKLLRNASAGMLVLLFTATLAFSQAASSTPVTGLTSGQSDRDLFGHAMWAGERAKFSEERILLQSLIESHPDSELVPRAKFAIADAWYAEGKFGEAKVEYEDLVTFFPNRPEVKEAQQKIDEIRAKYKM
jgi:outer membrane protein assembly factor BamD (BamD/ComL family)